MQLREDAVLTQRDKLGEQVPGAGEVGTGDVSLGDAVVERHSGERVSINTVLERGKAVQEERAVQSAKEHYCAVVSGTGGVVGIFITELA